MDSKTKQLGDYIVDEISKKLGLNDVSRLEIDRLKLIMSKDEKMTAYQAVKQGLLGNVTYATVYRWCVGNSDKLIKNTDWFYDDKNRITFPTQTIHKLRKEQGLISLQ